MPFARSAGTSSVSVIVSAAFASSGLIAEASAM